MTLLEKEISNLRCPCCFGDLTLGAGSLLCKKCNETFKKNGRVIYLNRVDTSWQLSMKTVKGYCDIHSKEPEKVENVAKLPDTDLKDFTHGFVANKFMFSKVLKFIGDIKGRRVIDIGAERGWAAHHFSRLGGIAYALECNDSPASGIGYAERLIDYDGYEFIPIVGDGYNIPLKNEVCDIVFICASLHHFTDKALILQEIYRILKHKGIFVAMGEPPRKEKEDLINHYIRMRANLERGENETFPTLVEYYRQFERTDFKYYFIYPWLEGFELNEIWRFGGKRRNDKPYDNIGQVFDKAHNAYYPKPDCTWFTDLIGQKTRKNLGSIERLKLTDILLKGGNSIMVAIK